MSKYVKNLMVREIAQRLEGVQDALLVNVIGIDANQTVALRRELREKDIHLLVVKNGMARRATEGTSLAPAFDGYRGDAGRHLGRRGFHLAGEGSHPARQVQDSSSTSRPAAA